MVSVREARDSQELRSLSVSSKSDVENSGHEENGAIFVEWYTDTSKVEALFAKLKMRYE